MKRNDRRALTAAALSAALFVPLCVFGAPALARTAASAGEYGSQYQYRVSVCHRTHSKKHPWQRITISQAALKAHLKHGDVVGTTCPTTAAANTKHHGKPTTTPTTTTTATTSTSPGKGHGNGGGNGNGNGNGKGHNK